MNKSAPWSKVQHYAFKLLVIQMNYTLCVILQWAVLGNFGCHTLTVFCHAYNLSKSLDFLFAFHIHNSLSTTNVIPPPTEYTVNLANEAPY